MLKTIHPVYVRWWDSNLGPLEHESRPVTTRPELTTIMWGMLPFMYRIIFLSLSKIQQFEPMHLSSPSTKELHGSSFWTKQEKGRKRERVHIEMESLGGSLQETWRSKSWFSVQFLALDLKGNWMQRSWVGK